MRTGEKAIGQPLDRVDGRLKVTGAARYAAEVQLENLAHGVLVRVAYREERAVTDFAAAAAHAFAPSETDRGEQRDKEPTKPKDYQRGDSVKALADAPVRVEATYTIAAEHHNPMEPHATVAAW